MSQSPRAALQLYGVRDFPGSLPDVVRQAGAAGFEGVEFANRFRNEDPGETATALAESGVEPVGVHADLPLVEAAVDGENDLLERCRTVGCERVVVPHVAARHFRSRAAVESLSGRLARLATELDAHGLSLGYHTIRHDLWPLLPDPVGTAVNDAAVPDEVVDVAAKWYARTQSGQELDETGLWSLFQETTSDDLFFELEAAEATAAGFDPGAVLGRLGERVSLVHLRDTARTGRLGDYGHVPHGEGRVDFEGVAEAARAQNVDWLVYENELDGDPETILSEGASFTDRLLA